MKSSFKNCILYLLWLCLSNLKFFCWSETCDCDKYSKLKVIWKEAYTFSHVCAASHIHEKKIKIIFSCVFYVTRHHTKFVILQTSELAVNFLLCLLFFLHIRFLEWKFYEKLHLVYLFLKTLIPISVCVHVCVCGQHLQ